MKKLLIVSRQSFVYKRNTYDATIGIFFLFSCLAKQRNLLRKILRSRKQKNWRD